MVKRMLKLLFSGLIATVVFTISAVGVMAQEKPQIPVPPGAAGVATTPISLNYTTELSVQQVVAFYSDYFTAHGFAITINILNSSTDGSAVMQYVDATGRVVDLVVNDEDPKSVVIQYSGDFDVAPGSVNITGGTSGEGSTGTGVAYVPVATPLTIELVFDASGSMAEALGDDTRIEAARRAVNLIAAALPDDANVRVGMRVFGQSGNNTDAGRDESCASTKLLVPVASNTDAALVDAAVTYEPTGWTPIALALNQAALDFTPDLAAGGRNVIILVSDGEETCGGDPAAVAHVLYGSDAQITTHVVAIASTEQTAPVLSAISVNGGGVFLNINAGNELAGGLLGLISSEVSNSGGKLVVPDAVAGELSISGQSGNITFANGQINIGGLVVSSAGIGGVNADASLNRLNITAGGASVDLDGINDSITFQTEDGGTVTLDGQSDSINIGGDDGTISIGEGGIIINPNPTTTPGG